MSIVILIEMCFCLFRSFEAFKNLHMRMISQIKRKTLPEIAKVVGLENEQTSKLKIQVETRLEVRLEPCECEIFMHGS